MTDEQELELVKQVLKSVGDVGSTVAGASVLALFSAMLCSLICAVRDGRSELPPPEIGPAALMGGMLIRTRNMLTGENRAMGLKLFYGLQALDDEYSLRLLALWLRHSGAGMAMRTTRDASRPENADPLADVDAATLAQLEAQAEAALAAFKKGTP